jgi:hypothetical protein
VAVTSCCATQVFDVDEALERPLLVLDDVEEGAPVELHVGTPRT